MFIKVTDLKHKDVNIINADNISLINTGAQTILLNGVHGEGHGLLRVSKEDIQKILNHISIVD